MHYKYLTLSLVGMASAFPFLNLPVVDEEQLPDIKNTQDAVGIQDARKRPCLLYH